VHHRPSRIMLLAFGLGLLGPALARGQEAAPPQEKAEPLTSPPPLKEVALGPVLRTVPVRRTGPEPNVSLVDTAVLPRDKQGIWVLDFAFKPIRMRTVEVNGKRRNIYYLYYRVVNRTGAPRMLVPHFTLVTDTGKRYEDIPLPMAVKLIQAREDPTKPLLGAVDIMGMIPPSTKEGIDDAVYGVAVWEGIDPHADAFKVYVQGLSDGYQVIEPPQGGKPIVRYKTLRIDFLRRGDARSVHEKEIELLDPPYEWIYW
jgi:hypothetical protein